MTEDFRSSLASALESMRREEEMKKQLTEQLTGVFEGYKAYKNSSVKATIPTERIRQLEESMPEFAEETQDGFTQEEVKRIVIGLTDYIIEGLNLKSMENSMLMVLFSIKVQKVDFSKCNGETLYEYVANNGALKELCSPEFKKKTIISAAAELAVEKGNISFNKAVHMILDKCRKGTFVDEAVADSKKDITQMCGIVTPLIDWYLKNEVEIIRWISN